MIISCGLPVRDIIISEHVCRIIQVSGNHLEKYLGTFPALLHVISGPFVTRSENDLQEPVKFVCHYMLPQMFATSSPSPWPTLWLTLLDEGYCPIQTFTVDIPSTTLPAPQYLFTLSYFSSCASFFSFLFFSLFFLFFFPVFFSLHPFLLIICSLFFLFFFSLLPFPLFHSFFFLFLFIIHCSSFPIFFIHSSSFSPFIVLPFTSSSSLFLFSFSLITCSWVWRLQDLPLLFPKVSKRWLAMSLLPYSVAKIR